MKLSQIIILITIVLITFSCVGSLIPESGYHSFVGKSDWTENEKACCYKSISNLENADSTYIIFKKSKIKSMGQAQPAIRYILKSPARRVYIIKVRDKAENPNLCFETIPDSAKVGLIGHEIVHVLDYQAKSFFQIIGMGFKYSWCPNYRKKTEWMTDSLTIINNMAYENLCFARFIYNSPYVSEKYLKKKKKFYMTPDDMLRIIRSMNKQ